MRPGSSLGSGRTGPQLSTRASFSDLKRPGSARGYRPQSPRLPVSKSRPGSSLGSRPSTPSSRPDPYTGTIKVSVRPNPYTDTASSKNWIIQEYSNTITNVNDSTSYNFDNIFPSSTNVTNRQVYEKSCAHLVHSFLNDGYNCTLFAYGMTGSGKTYSMRGEEHDPGFVRLAIDDIFDKVGSQSVTKKHTLCVSYLEIYNEKIIDLLSNSPQTSDLKIRDDPDYGTRIVGVNAPTIQSKEHLQQLIRLGDTKRKTSATDYNARSSRSHAILQIRLHTVDMLLNTEVRCTLSLCDLAGSERATSSLERRKEGAFINKSLLALSTVINKLSLMSTSSNSTGMEHVPYRDSKLTRLLQPALSGSSLILILCTIHLGSNQNLLNQQLVTETYNTLRFAARAKDIIMTVNTTKKAVDGNGDQETIDELRRQVEEQKAQIQELKLQPKVSGTADSSLMSELQAELMVQNEKIEHLTRLNDLQKTETILLRNDTFNDILGVDVDKTSLQMMMSNLEEFYKRVNYEMEEYRRYIAHLEVQLKNAQQQSLMLQSLVGAPKAARSHISENYYEELMKEQEEEIWQLKETIKDKDHIIHGLTKTSKLRRLVDSNTTATSDQAKRRPSVTASSGPGKENLFPKIRDFNLSPKRSNY